MNQPLNPEFYWARANGWAMLASVELLNVLPADHPRRDQVLERLRAHIRSIAKLESGTSGLWHQMLDKPDSYLESSASAIFEQDNTSTFSSVTQRIEEVKSEAYSNMSSFLAEFRRNLLGEVRKKAKLKNVLARQLSRRPIPISIGYLNSFRAERNRSTRNHPNKIFRSLS